jgi:hypothetical protein
MEATPLESAILREASDAAGFTIIFHASTEYSIIGKKPEKIILLWNEGSSRISARQPEEAVGKADSSILRVPKSVRDKVQTILDYLAQFPNGDGMSPGHRGTRQVGRNQVWAISRAQLVDNAARYVPRPNGSGT